MIPLSISLCFRVFSLLGELGELVLTTTVRAHMRAHVCAHVELKGSDSPNSPDSPF